MPPSDVVTKGSALHCDCNVRWLKEWLLDKNLGDITCASPAKVKGVSVTKLKERHLVCGMFTVFNQKIGNCRLLLLSLTFLLRVSFFPLRTS